VVVVVGCAARTRRVPSLRQQWHPRRMVAAPLPAPLLPATTAASTANDCPSR
jgi:hypothetical protein